MSEQTPQPENAGPDTAKPETPALSDQPRSRRKTSVADAMAHISITQLTLAVLVIIFLWQWLDGHRAIGDMQQQLAKKIAEMDGNSKANQVLLTQAPGSGSRSFRQSGNAGITLCRVAKSARRAGNLVQQPVGKSR